MKTFAELNDDDLEKIRTKIENKLRDSHHLFLGFFPDVVFTKIPNEDDMIFHINTQKLFGGTNSSSQPADLIVKISSAFGIQVSGKGTEGSDGPEIAEIIKSAIVSYLAEEGFIEEVSINACRDHLFFAYQRAILW